MCLMPKHGRKVSLCFVIIIELTPEGSQRFGGDASGLLKK